MIEHNFYSAAIQSTQRIINAAFVQRLLHSMHLFNSCISLTTLGARSHLRQHNISGSGFIRKKSLSLMIWCVDYTLRGMYRSRSTINLQTRSDLTLWIWISRLLCFKLNGKHSVFHLICVSRYISNLEVIGFECECMFYI
jgi:hypothetical protein